MLIRLLASAVGSGAVAAGAMYMHTQSTIESQARTIAEDHKTIDSQKESLDFKNKAIDAAMMKLKEARE
jgi:hypothetical protein